MAAVNFEIVTAKLSDICTGIDTTGEIGRAHV